MNISSRLFSIALCGLMVSASSMGSCSAKEFSIGTQSESKLVNAVIVSNPVPEIPSEFKGEAFKSCCLAKFKIDHEGKCDVHLQESTGNQEIDHIVIATLKKWKFKPAMLDETPVASTRKLRIELEVD